MMKHPASLPLGRDNDEACVLHPFPEFPCGIETVSHWDCWLINILLALSPSPDPFLTHLLYSLPNTLLTRHPL